MTNTKPSQQIAPAGYRYTPKEPDGRNTDTCLMDIGQALVQEAMSGQPLPALLDDLLSHAKIMIVDDEVLNISVVTEHLKSGGYRELVSTADPKEALTLAVREQPDVILLDLHMPGVDGFEILKKIRAQVALASVPVVILTASTDYREKLGALVLGATDFLQKPLHSVNCWHGCETS